MSMLKRAGRTRRLGYETLERREVFAGNIFAAQYGATLYLLGDGAANIASVTSGAARQFTVAGTGTTVNGAASRTFSNISHIVTDLGAGNDQLSIGTPTTPVAIAGILTVIGGLGDDTINVSANVGAYMSIDGLSGRDTINVVNSRAGTGAYINGGEGDDRITIDNSTFNYILSVSGLGGADTVTMKNTRVAGVTVIDGGLGADTFVNQGGNSLGAVYRISI